MRHVLTALVIAAVALVAGCGESAAPAPQAAAGVSLPESLFAGAAPADAKDVLAIKKEAKVGDEVVMTARIAGTRQPFSAERAIITVTDRHMLGCESMGEDHCKTPWDMCCASSEDKVANGATVQVVGADGKPLKLSLKDRNGLKPDAHIVVVGKVAARDAEAKTLTVNASRIHIKTAS